MRSLALAAMAASLLVVTVPGAAQAWSGMHYCSGGSPCNPGSSGCQPIGWAPGNPNTVWRLSSSYTSADLSNGQVDAAIGAAFNEWGAPGCTEFNPVQSADTPGNPLDNGNSNHIIGFLESNWPPSYGSSTLAVTMPGWYQAPYCEFIENADMVINSVNHNWVNGQPGNWNQADLQSVIVHEAGHWVGFDHNNYAGSSLRATYSGGISERTLTCDDTEGVCAIYPSSGNACTADRYCDCGVGCNGGYCGGTPSGDDDDSTPSGDDDTAGDDDDNGGDISGPCNASTETFYETEPNDWVDDEDVDWFQSGGGDTSVVGSLTCGNNGSAYTADKDLFVVDFPCTDTARFTLRWNTNSDLDFYVYGTSGDPLEESATAEMSGPVTADGLAGGRVYVNVMCWAGDSATYEFLFDWTPFQGSTIGDDDDTGSSGDDDTSSSGDDDTSGSGDDDTSSDDDDDLPARRGCSCYELDEPTFAGTGSTPLDAGLLLGGLFLVGLRRRRSDGVD